MQLRKIGIWILVIGVVIYAIGLALAPLISFLVYQDVTTVRRPFNPVWPHSAPEVNPAATAGFDLAILGAIIVMIGIVTQRRRKHKTLK